MISPLQLSSYLVEALSVESVSGYDPEAGALHGSISIVPDEAEIVEGVSYELGLSVTVDPTDGQEEYLPYRVSMSARARFSIVDDSIDAEERDRLLSLNGSAILLGQMRAQIAQVTALGRYGAMWLPVINLVEYFDAAEGPNNHPK